MSPKPDIPKAVPIKKPQRKYRKPVPVDEPCFDGRSIRTEERHPARTESPPVTPDPAIEAVQDTKEQAEEIVERVFGDDGSGTLTRADKAFVSLNRMYIVLVAKARGIDLVDRFLDCINKSYDRGMNKKFNKDEPSTALGCRKHVTDTVGDLAGIKAKDSGKDEGKTIEIVFSDAYNPDGTNTRKVGVKISAASETT